MGHQIADQNYLSTEIYASVSTAIHFINTYEPIFANMRMSRLRILRKQICIEKLQHQSRIGSLIKQKLMSVAWSRSNTVVPQIPSL
ncbi:MAG: hypothetical protein DYH15_06930 [Nitrosomonas sp. PRO4]|nr:hypothetical protein [Nitrosomonas sp. PRO4]